jgi:ABC-type glycerol-3-phosphate transport system substrate-binding protein
MEGSNSIDHVTSQTMFLNDSAAMMVNGSWIANEMASVEDSMENFAMMRTPVLSAITDKLTTVKSDAQLRKVITAIDNVHDGVKQISDYQSGEGYNVDGIEVSKEDWDYIQTARFTVASNFSGENACIPSYSENVEGAKAFLSFLYSDEGYRVYAKALKNPMPMTLSQGELDTSDWNAFQISQVDLMEEAVAMPCYYVASRHDIFKVGGATKFADVPYVSELCASNKADRKSADAIWDEIVAKVNDNYENKWLANIKK